MKLRTVAARPLPNAARLIDERELARVDRELVQLTQEMRTQGHNLYQQLAGALPPNQLAALNKVLARPVLTLGAEDFQLDGQALSKALGDAHGEHAGLPGLQLRVA